MGEQLYEASQSGDVDKVKSLVEGGAEVNWINNVSNTWATQQKCCHSNLNPSPKLILTAGPSPVY